MSTNHTQEPWSVAEESFDNDGIQESVIRGLDGRAAIAVTLDFGPNNPEMREANARRIAACVNSCAGISTENLEQNKPLKEGLHGLNARIRNAEQQRDELLAELELAHIIIRNALNCMDISAKLEWGAKNRKDKCAGEGSTRANERESLIAKAKGGA